MNNIPAIISALCAFVTLILFFLNNYKTKFKLIISATRETNCEDNSLEYIFTIRNVGRYPVCIMNYGYMKKKDIFSKFKLFINDEKLISTEPKTLEPNKIEVVKIPKSDVNLNFSDTKNALYFVVKDSENRIYTNYSKKIWFFRINRNIILK